MHLGIGIGLGYSQLPIPQVISFVVLLTEDGDPIESELDEEILVPMYAAAEE